MFVLCIDLQKYRINVENTYHVPGHYDTKTKRRTDAININMNSISSVSAANFDWFNLYMVRTAAVAGGVLSETVCSRPVSLHHHTWYIRTRTRIRIRLIQFILLLLLFSH